MTLDKASDLDTLPTVGASEVAETVDLDADAATILARIEPLLAEAAQTTEAQTIERIRTDLWQVRADLFEIVVKRYNGDRDEAGISDDFSAEFRMMTDFIQPKPKQPSRRFPGIEYKKQGDR